MPPASIVLPALLKWPLPTVSAVSEAETTTKEFLMEHFAQRGVWTRAALLHRWRQGWPHRTGHEQPPGLQSLLRALCYTFREGEAEYGFHQGLRFHQGGFMWDLGCSRPGEAGHGCLQECEAGLGLLQGMGSRDLSLWFKVRMDLGSCLGAALCCCLPAHPAGAVSTGG